MSSFNSRQITVLFVAFAVAVGSLLVAGSALADAALFRVEQRWHNSSNPPVTPGGAGMYQAYIQPRVTKTAMGADYIYPAPKAIVETGNPIGGKFTLPQSFITYSQTATCSECKAWWLGYTTTTHSVYYNGPGVFEPNHGATGPTRIVFPTTMGNPYPTYTSTYQKWINGNYGDGVVMASRKGTSAAGSIGTPA